MKQKNYKPKTAKVKFIVYWQKENTDQEIRIILPEIYFERINENAENSLFLAQFKQCEVNFDRH